MPTPPTAEHQRLADSEARRADWKNWGPYVADRAWGTVREDYSANGDAWEYFPHEHARSRAFRWNEDGIAGFCNRYQNACLGVAVWNEQDRILKERFFGVTGPQGNHGEDVKEVYYYLDGTPTHSYMRMLYKYPQVTYPYNGLVEENGARGYRDAEYEITDALSDAFEAGRYFDIRVEYAKASDDDILCRITATNRAQEAAPIHLLPHLWYRNTWSWGYNDDKPKPTLTAVGQEGRGKGEMQASGVLSVRGEHRHLGVRRWSVRAVGAESAELMFTENESNNEALFGTANASPYVKDAFHRAIVDGEVAAVNPKKTGTKVTAHVRATVEPGASLVVEVRYAPEAAAEDTAPEGMAPEASGEGTGDEEKRKGTETRNASASGGPFADFADVFEARLAEADEFYGEIQRPGLSEDETAVQRQAFAGLVWTKQFYHYSVKLWLDGDPAFPPPPEARKHGRNHDWEHLYNVAVLSMPDKWEYPWYAAWDLAFHMIPMAILDPEWSKRQLTLLMREWYQHPNGQLPAYEWEFGDVNPPVHAWAALRVYQIDRKQRGEPDTDFLEAAFHKLLVNFTWWVNQKDDEGNNVFQGGFLGLDNIGVFDRSKPLPTGGHLDQADGTAWMGMYCLNMLAIALELARTRPAYEDMATKFFEHFVYIAQAINDVGGTGLWDDEDGFYYDAIETPDGRLTPLKIRSFVGLIPLFAVETIDPEVFEALPSFTRRMRWFLENRPELMNNLTFLREHGAGDRCLLSIVDETRLRRILERMLDPEQFLSDYGLRSLSKEHEAAPFTFEASGETHRVAYDPAESTSGLFGGNSNWRGPVWFPLNYLMIESLQKFDYYYGRNFKLQMPTGQGEPQTLWKVAGDLSRRLSGLFLRDASGRRPTFGGQRAVPGKRALARPRPLLRVLQRRRRRGPGREPPDRVDGARSEADPAERRESAARRRIEDRPLAPEAQTGLPLLPARNRLPAPHAAHSHDARGAGQLGLWRRGQKDVREQGGDEEEVHPVSREHPHRVHLGPGERQDHHESRDEIDERVDQREHEEGLLPCCEPTPEDLHRVPLPSRRLHVEALLVAPREQPEDDGRHDDHRQNVQLEPGKVLAVIRGHVDIQRDRKSDDAAPERDVEEPAGDRRSQWRAASGAGGSANLLHESAHTGPCHLRARGSRCTTVRAVGSLRLRRWTGPAAEGLGELRALG